MQRVTEQAYLDHMNAMGELVDLIIPLSQSGATLDDIDLSEQGVRNSLFNNSICESMGRFGQDIYASILGAIKAHKKTYGVNPDINVLAAAGAQVKQFTDKFDSKVIGAINESTTSANAPIAPFVAAAAIPLPLISIASQLAITLPPSMTAKDEALFYQVIIKAGKTWGNYKAGDRIDNQSLGDYTNMYRKKQVGTGNGTKTSFDVTLDAPVKQDSLKLLIDRRYVGEYVQSSNKVIGAVTIADTKYTLEASVTDAKPGVATVTSTPALPAGIEIHVQYDANLENNPDIMPSIEYDYLEMKLKPHESVLTTTSTIQADEKFRRNISFSLFGSSESDLTNQLGSDHDTSLMSLIAFFAKSPKEPIAISKKISPATYHDIALFHLKLLEAIEEADDRLKIQTFGIAGLRYIFGSNDSIRMFKLLPRDMFEPSGITVQRGNTPQYVGRLMGKYLIFSHPRIAAEKKDKLICVAKGSQWNQGGAVTGLASPFTPFESDKRAETFELIKTIRGTRFEEVGMNIDGADYFTEITLTSD